MLGTRTKQVFSYGRRGQRVVNVYDDYDRKKTRDSEVSSTNLKPENDVPIAHTSAKSAKEVISGKSITSLKDSPMRSLSSKRPRKSPKTAKVGKVDVGKPVRRHPLGSIAPNAPASPVVPPAVRAPRRPTVRKVSPLAPNSPIVSVDILVLDAKGRRVSEEHRVSRADVQANTLSPSPPIPARPIPRVQAKSKKAAQVIVISSDSEDEVPVARPKRAAKGKARPLIISDDEEDSGSDYNPFKNASDADTSIEEVVHTTPRFRRGVQRTKSNAILSPSPTPSLSPPSSPPKEAPAIPGPSRVPPSQRTSIPPTQAYPLVRNQTLPAQLARPLAIGPFASLPDFDNESGPSRSKARVLTPIRRRPGRAPFPAPPSPPSPTTPSEVDLDMSFDFGQLALSPSALAEVQRLEAESAPSIPAYVRPLLDECAQPTPHEFSAFIEMFPHDPIVRVRASAAAPTFQKIGEASFSEVFGIGDVVLKIVPLRDEERGGVFLDADGPAPSDAKDVLQEIIVTRAMGACCPGFVELLRTYVVRGKYPSLLLDLWDEYDQRKGSESVRPDTFTVSQLYAIIVLPNGGPDLEAYTFSTPTKTGWRQACSVFWQVTRTLAEAEELVSFEHRDLHWGQILIKDVPAKKASRRKTHTLMDDPDHGVLVTIIDLGLARMNAHDGVHWTPFDEETFEGEGDYQFDVYRMMRNHNEGAWEEFRPLTNVMWLHYLVLKLLQSKHLRAPGVPRKSTAVQLGTGTGFSERECYECLKEIEGILAQRLAGIKAPQAAKKGRRKTQAPSKVTKVKDAAGPQSAAELLGLAVARGWVE